MNKKVITIGVAVLAVVILGVVLVKKNGGPSIVKSSDGASAQQIYLEANSLKQNGEFLKAQETYKKILNEHPDFDKMETVQKELESLNMQIILSNTPTPETIIHEIQQGDSLGKIAQKYGTTIDLIKISNNLKGDTIRLGQKLRVWTGKFSILVDKSQNILILKDGNDVVRVYHVSTGEKNSTPVGTYKITSKLVDPVWFNKGVVVPPESPQNVLGSRWLGFDIPGYGIHGTIEPDVIGQQITAGCVRMRNQEVEELYSLIPLGTQVTITD